MTPLRIALLSVAVVLAVADPATAGNPWSGFTARPAEYPAVYVERDIPIGMSDGVTLFADLYRPATDSGEPASGRFPVVLVQTPYGKSGQTKNHEAGGIDLNRVISRSPKFPTRGYVQVIVDVRGTGASEGEWEMFGAREQRDGYEVVKWAHEQPWSTGDVGLFGFSAMGANQFFTAAQRPPGLKAIFPAVAPADLYRDLFVNGGEFNPVASAAPLLVINYSKLLPPGYMQSNPAAGTEWLEDRATRGVNFTAETVTSQLAGDGIYDSPFWRLRAPENAARRIRVPTFIAGGWLDVFNRGSHRTWRAIPVQPGRKQLLYAPWAHLTAGEGLGADGQATIEDLAVRWFDRWLRRQTNRIDTHFGPVTVFENGTGGWARDRSWPRPGIRWHRYYLRGEKSGSAASLNDGSLRIAPPETAGTDTGEASVPAGGCTRSTTVFSLGAVPGDECAQDNRPQERTAFTYTTEQAAEPLQMSGAIALRLRASTTARDLTWVATITDVHPDGRSEPISAGWLKASHRALDEARTLRTPIGDAAEPFHPHTKATLAPVEPGATETYEVELWPSDWTVRPGHRLRLVVSSSDLPHFAPPPGEAPQRGGSVQTVARDPADPSFLSVPVRAANPRPRLRLRAKWLNASGPRCERAQLRLSLRGADANATRQVKFRVGNRSRLDKVAPFIAVLRDSSSTRRLHAAAHVKVLGTERPVRLRKRIRRCGH